MDNRWRVLYYRIGEMWGRQEEVGAGEGRAGASAGQDGEEKPPEERGEREADRKEVGKPMGNWPRKAANKYSVPVPETDTGGRGENPKADERSVVKELGKMAP